MDNNVTFVLQKQSLFTIRFVVPHQQLQNPALERGL